MFRHIGQVAILFGLTLAALPLTWRHRRKVAEQLLEIGVASLFMACILSVFIGGVIALQSGPVLVERAMESVLGGLVGLSICKELAPVMMAVLVAGRVGSAMTAEIGSMQVYQEIDALRTMQINPVHYLVLPRLVAITIALPLLVLFSILAAWSGGALVAIINAEIQMAPAMYFNSLRDTVAFADVLNGLLKGLLFSLVIVSVCCHQGFATVGGPRGIGHSVTKAVVNSLVLILVLDYFFTRVLLFLGI